MLNEFAGIDFPYASYVPSGDGYDQVLPSGRAYATQGAVPGQDFVSGSTYLSIAYGYENSHRWRNWGVMIAFAVLYLGLHLAAANDIESSPRTINNHQTVDSDSGTAGVEKQISVFHWGNVYYDIKIKGEPRCILDEVDRWVKPGTLTALMGSSGAGKTTLLDVLASRATMGVVLGDMLVNGIPRDDSFQRKTSYV
ncbi:hypothetical protein BFJ66_g15196 [Fusarium oxysporum f. sp. cepae]|uniref:ABC transporter domain-containing protein n=1 Tax=Fusarium oxysporum f. sp. cepae TaxID=396571 RepID=A0A3L6NFG5_FUSOX|nr:hypothetical protein BFJ65_g10247 [Fusarium oxysporum f. sp. cepae]RKK32814.1 hypothetical protein BFJ66_g15196 [Fusarium oxysporum f. sp. cepae]